MAIDYMCLETEQALNKVAVFIVEMGEMLSHAPIRRAEIEEDISNIPRWAIISLERVRLRNELKQQDEVLMRQVLSAARDLIGAIEPSSREDAAELVVALRNVAWGTKGERLPSGPERHLDAAAKLLRCEYY